MSGKRQQLINEMSAAVNRLTKWKMLFAGWQLGTRLVGDPECDALRDHREVTLCMRAELNAMLALLMRARVFTEEEWFADLRDEAERLSRDYEDKFPGARATDIGIDIDVQRAKGWMSKWRS